MPHYIIPASLNDSQKSTSRKRNGARKRPVNSMQLTFGQLKEKLANIILKEVESKQVYANLVSALNALMTACTVTDNNSVSSILRASFYKNCAAHVSMLSQQKKSAAYIANRKSYLGRWHRLVVALDREYAAASGQVSPFSAALLEVSHGIPHKRLAAQAGISLASFKRWLTGSKPNEKARPSIIRLERFFAITPGELIGLAGLGEKFVGNTNTVEVPRIRYRERLSEMRGDYYAMKDATPSLRDEWAGLVQYKIARTTYSKARQKNGRWSTTTEKVVPRTVSNWHSFSGIHYVASAGVQWRNVSNYLGWLHLSTERGGYGLPSKDAQTLAHLTNCEFLGQYIDWRIERAEQKVNGSVTSLLKLVSSLCHPKTGYFCNTPHLCSALSINEATWRERCDETFKFAKETLSMLSDQCELSRNSFEPLKSLLELDNPMDGVADAIQRLNAAQPSTGGVKEAIWARDRLLLKLLSSNPLRAKNLKMLKFIDDKTGQLISGDDTGKLYRGRDGTWRIAIPKKFFKNFAGAAKDRDYDMPVHNSISRDIETFLELYRPRIASDDNPYVFTSSKKVASAGMMYSLNRRVEILSRLYFWRCPGFGPHGFRHIVATAILKMSPNDWQTASLVLHDRPETVQKHYAHLRSNDGAERQFAILASSYERM